MRMRPLYRTSWCPVYLHMQDSWYRIASNSEKASERFESANWQSVRAQTELLSIEAA